MTQSDLGLNLLYVDEVLLIADKPAGLLSVPGRGPNKQDCLVSRIQTRYPEALTVHRLDMATSGLMVFARGAMMQRKLSFLFQERLVHKRYIALLQGTLAPDTGEIDLPLIADWPNRPLQKVDVVGGKPALTRFTVLDRSRQTTRVALEPVTGRSHQLRLHMASLGHPILGDALYGDESSASRLMLHASDLHFLHPVSARSLNFSSAPPY